MSTVFNKEEAHEVIWGSKSNVSEDMFKRWCQGFEFSEFEETALIQFHGGPCSIIASVQGHIFKNMFFENSNNVNNDIYMILLEVLEEILELVSLNNSYVVAYVENDNDEEIGSVSFTYFHDRLRFTQINNIDDLEALLLSIQPILHSPYGILCFLYSVIMTYGVEEMKSAMSDETPCLIDPIYGHSSQCLTNLLITGRASPYLFDNEKDLGGYIISGILTQPKIGFLTIMEYLRYCEVGWNLKNPKTPIWILASETHLTVLFSKDINVIEKDNNILRKAEKSFATIDVNDQGFLMPDQIQDYLKSLDLPIDNEYISKLEIAVDPEKLGLFLKSNLLKYLYPEEFNSVETSYKFQIFHYNGLSGSNKNREVRYAIGEAVVEDFNSQTKDYSANDSQMLKCLRTKWPTISIRWENCIEEPSLN